ncbi:caspase family protein [Myxacorys almedinensis]|uniref:Peptidase C14 caspase domain-containing protein n=1 Tax=Myxacorys almedinensis A TaxID=2690445 RepID=A0A8J8CP63_9CYAN|nr:caspase family protein [Myxacorys almedinensis]NDJ19142.1 hypothetical protein [Myxacorys almedinensis A]
MSRTPSRPEIALQSGQAKLWILMVSVQHYDDPHLPALPYAAIDCQSLAYALTQATRAFPERTISIHHDLASRTPTLGAVRESLQEIAEYAQPQDTVLFYFCGHGVLEPRLQQAVLCLADTQKEALLKTGLSAIALLGSLGNCQAKQQVVWLDTCHRGEAKLNSVNHQTLDQLDQLDDPTVQLIEMLHRRAAQHPGFDAFLSCDRFQQSWKFPELGHGLFTYVLMQGLQGEAANSQGIIDTDRLCDYVYSHTLQHLNQRNQEIRSANQHKQDWEERQPEYTLQKPRRIVKGNEKIVLGLKLTDSPISTVSTVANQESSSPSAPDQATAQDSIKPFQPEIVETQLPPRLIQSIVPLAQEPIIPTASQITPPFQKSTDLSFEQRQREEIERRQEIEQRQREEIERQQQRQKAAEEQRQQEEAERRRQQLEQQQREQNLERTRQQVEQRQRQEKAKRLQQEIEQRRQEEAKRHQQEIEQRQREEAERLRQQLEQRQRKESERRQQEIEQRQREEEAERLRQFQKAAEEQRQREEAERLRQQLEQRQREEAERHQQEIEQRQREEAEREQQRQKAAEAQRQREEETERRRKNEQRQQAETEQQAAEALRQREEVERYRQQLERRQREEEEAERRRQEIERRQHEAAERQRQQLQKATEAQRQREAQAERRHQQLQKASEMTDSLKRLASTTSQHTVTAVGGLKQSTHELTHRFVDQQRSPQTRKVVAFTLGGLGLLASGMAVFSLYQHRNAQLRDINALSTTSETLLSSQPQTALVTALQAGRRLQKLDQPWNLLPKQTKLSAIATLQQAITRSQPATQLSERQPITAIAYRSDGQKLATASSESGITLWNKGKDSGRWERSTTTFKSHTEPVTKLQFSPDGTLLASASIDKTIKLWNLEKRILIKTLPGHSDRVIALRFRPDGGVLASGSVDRTIKLWTVPKGDLVETLKGSEAAISAIAFSADGRILAAGSSDNTLRLWYPESNQPILLGHHNVSPDPAKLQGITDLTFSPDGKAIASSGWDKTIKLWTVSNAKPEREASPYLTLNGHRGIVTSVSFSLDGQNLASGSQDKTINLWNLRSGGVIKTLSGHQDTVESLSFHGTEETLMSVSDRNGILIWDLNLATLIKQGCSQLNQSPSDISESDLPSQTIREIDAICYK